MERKNSHVRWSCPHSDGTVRPACVAAADRLGANGYDPDHPHGGDRHGSQYRWRLMSSPSRRPTGTVTFLFTDIEGSTSAWDTHHHSMASALIRHDEILRNAIGAFDGWVFSTGGDGVAAAFHTAKEAAAAALAAQIALESEQWPEPLCLRVRMGLNTGEAIERDGDYFGPAVIKAARLMALVDGGRIAVSSTTADVVRHHLPPDTRLLPVGTVRLKGLEGQEAVFVLAAPGLGETGAPLAAHGIGARLPPATTSAIVGRTAELEAVQRAMHHHRVVTLTGIGGIGKTRLAVAVAERSAGAFRDGVAWVELAPALDDDAVVHEIAAAIGARPQIGHDLTDTVAAALTDRQMLVVFDNCEHLREGIARILDTLLRAGASATFLTTSRQRLGLDGEHLIALGPLDVVEPDAAHRLLVERLTGVDDLPDDALAEIVRQTDGIPLAIELAAARCRALGVRNVAERLGGALRLFTDPQLVTERHRTLEGVIDWSYRALSAEAQTTFRYLSVMLGSFTLDTAEAVSSDGTLTPLDVDDALTELVDRSLLVRAQGRFRMLEPTRRFASDRLVGEDADRCRSRHVIAMSARVDRCHRGIASADEARWVVELDADWPDVRAAVRHCLDTDSRDEAINLVVHLALESFNRRPEAFAWIDEAVRRYGDQPSARRHELLGAASYVAWTTLNIDRAVLLAEEALALEPAPGASLDILPQAGAMGAYNFSGQPLKAVVVATDALARSGENMPLSTSAWLRASEALSRALCGDAGAVESARRAVECGERSANPSALGMALYAQVVVHLVRGGNPIETALAHDRGVSLAASVRNQWLLGMFMGLPRPNLHQGDPAAQLTATLDVIDDFLHSGWTTHAWGACWLVPDLLVELDRTIDAATWLGACAASSVPRLQLDALPHLLEQVKSGTASAELLAACALGGSMSFSELRRHTGLLA